MKKLMVVLIAVFIVAFVPSFSYAETLEQFNKTGGFEIEGWSLADAGWTISGTERWISGEEPYKGKKALKLWDDEEIHKLDLTMSKNVTGLDKGTYEISFYLRGDFMKAYFSVDKNSKNIAVSSSWKNYKVRFNVVSKESVNIKFVFIGKDGTKPWAWMDGISIKKVQ